ncbi:MAG TPA: hypothetical protein PLF13_04945 [candidate division Zixibacteria bacterium]|nr:hypothetical protein [candidate division Zixibacteria bacterium]
MRLKVTPIIVLFVTAITLTGPACIREKTSDRIDSPGPYLAQPLPGELPELFARDKVSTQFDERDACFSADGLEFYYTLMGPERPAILCITLDDERWTRPRVAAFSGRYPDLEPAFSPDGSRLYFASKRPMTGQQPPNWDIWYTTRSDSGWNQPINIDAPINSGGDEFYPSLAANGNLYFTAERPEGLGKEDIYRARMIDGLWSAPENLGASINSEGWEFNAFVAPDESYLIYTAVGRDDDLGNGDLYISFADSSGTFGPAVNMGPTVNSTSLDYCPYVTPDGRFLFFTSRRLSPMADDSTRLSYDDILQSLRTAENGRGNIYWMSTAIIDSLRPRQVR